jgi:hypothetical protein
MIKSDQTLKTGYISGDTRTDIRACGKRGADVRPYWQKRYAPLSASA